MLVPAVLVLFSTSVRASSEDVARQLVEHLTNENPEGVYQLFDLNIFADRVARNLFEGEENHKAFKEGFFNDPERLKTTVYQLFGEPTQGRTFTFVRMLTEGDQSRPLVRLVLAEGGVEYLLLEVINDKIVDMFIASKGKTSIESTSELLQLTINPASGFIKRLFGKKEADEKLLEQVKTMSVQMTSGQNEAAFSTLMAMPEEVRNARVMIETGILLASRISDKLYSEQLSRLAQRFGNLPDTQFLLIDHYIYTEQLDKALESVDRIIERFGKDGPLLEIRSSINFLSNDVENAIVSIRTGIESEPTYESSYWVYIELMMHTYQYSEVLNTLDVLSHQFGYQFTRAALEAEPFYQALTRSEAYQNWTPVNISVPGE